MSDRYICRYQEDMDKIEADSMIEAIMQFYRDYELFPDQVTVELPGENDRNYGAEILILRELLDKRTAERDYTVQKLHDVYHAVKEAMSTERP